MTNTGEMDTMSTVLQHLHSKEQDNEFTVDGEGNVWMQGRCYAPDDLFLLRTFRFEGASDPDEEAILYLIAASDGTVGYSIDTYGAFSNSASERYTAFIYALHSRPR